MCCYARSEKHWVTDPQGVAWERYRTMGAAEVFGKSRDPQAQGDEACCAGTAARGKPIAVPVKASACC